MYEFNDLCVGVLICKDIEFAVFSRIGAIGLKETISAQISQVCTLLSVTTQNFIKSGVQVSSLDTAGNKIRIQKDHKPIHVKLPAPM